MPKVAENIVKMIVALYCMVGTLVLGVMLFDLVAGNSGQDLLIPWHVRNWLGPLAGVGFLGGMYWLFVEQRKPESKQVD